MIFTDTDPADSDSVKLGAQQIREMKEILNESLGLLYSLSPVDDPDGTVSPVAGAVSATLLASNSVTTAKILDANVTTAKILDANITAAKLATDSVTTIKIADNNVTTAKIADNNVTTAKITAGTNGQILTTQSGATVWATFFQATANQAFGNAAEAIDVSVAHGLSAVPSYVRWVMVCTDAGGDAGFSQNDEVSIYGPHESTVQPTLYADATNIGVSLITGVTMRVYNKSTQALTNISRSKWRLKAYFAL